jgi:hypothetical protein
LVDQLLMLVQQILQGSNPELQQMAGSAGLQGLLGGGQQGQQGLLGGLLGGGQQDQPQQPGQAAKQSNSQGLLQHSGKTYE